MGNATRIDEIHLLTVEEFLATPQWHFGDAWRYELIDGVPVAQAGPSRDHGRILNNLSGMLGNQLWNHETCEPFTGTFVVPRGRNRRTVRIPDAVVECRNGRARTVLMFEVASPADDIGTTLRNRRRRRELQAVPGAAAIIEIREDAPAVHVHRRVGNLWVFEDIIDINDTLINEGAGLEFPLSDLYHRVFDRWGVKTNQDAE